MPDGTSGRRGPLLDGQELAARPARQARVEGELEPADARVLVGGIAGVLELCLLIRVGAPGLAGDVDRVAAEWGGAVVGRAGRKRHVVLRQDRGPPAEGESAADDLPLDQVREGEVRGPRDLAAVKRQAEHPVDLAEQVRAHSDPDVDDVGAVDALRPVGVARVDRRGGGGLLGVAISAREVLRRVLLLGRVRELVVHRGVVLMGPVVHEALGHVLLGAAGRADHAEDEGDQGDDAQRQRAPAQAPLALGQGPTLRRGRLAGAPRGRASSLAGP